MKLKNQFECSICKKKIRGKVGSIVNLGRGKLIVKCKKCTRNTVSTAHQPEVMVVPVTQGTMNFIIRNKRYYHPMSYRRKGGHYLAFYVKDPTSAITHYAKVKYILKNIPLESLMDTSQIKVNEEEKLFKLYEFDTVEELPKPVKKGNRGAIQNIQNTTLGKLKSAKTLNDI